MRLNKTDYLFQIAIYRDYKRFGFSYEDLKKLNLKQLKELFNKCEVIKKWEKKI